MSVTFVREENDSIAIGIDGILTFDDLQEMQNKQREKISQNKKVKVLILAEKFTGWGKGGDWGDLTFMYELDPYIEKIAIVSEGKWKDEILIFAGAGRRKALVEFFFPDEVQEAHTWLADAI